MHLYFHQRPIFSKDRHPPVKIVVVFLLRHIEKLLNHEVRRKIGIATGAVTLRCAAEIQTRLGKKIMFDIEASLMDVRVFVSDQGPKKKRHRAGMHVLADLQRDSYLLFQWRRNVLRHHIFRCVVLGQRFEVELFRRSGERCGYALVLQSFPEYGCSKTARLWNNEGGHDRLSIGREVAGESYGS